MRGVGVGGGFPAQGWDPAILRVPGGPELLPGLLEKREQQAGPGAQGHWPVLPGLCPQLAALAHVALLRVRDETPEGRWLGPPVLPFLPPAQPRAAGSHL